MTKWKTVAGILLTVIFAGIGFAYQRGNFNPAPQTPVVSQRVLVFAPHPDDEVLGCAGLIQIALQKQSQVAVVYFTNGDAYTDDGALMLPGTPPGTARMRALGSLRQAESREAMKTLGVPAADVIFLSYPDSGLSHLWYDNWNPAQPYTSPATGLDKVTGPAFDPGAPYAGASVAADVARIIAQFNPTDVYYTDPNEADTDNLAAGYFVKYALLASGHNPVEHTYLIHHNGAAGVDWPPSPSDAPQPTTPLLPPASLTGTDITWQTLALTPQEVQGQETAYQAYRSQMKIRPGFFNAFVRKNELFGNNPVQKLAPASDLTFFPDTARWTKEEIGPAVPPGDNLTGVAAALNGPFLGLGLQAASTLDSDHTNIWNAFLFGPPGSTPARLVVYVKRAHSFAQLNSHLLYSSFVRSDDQIWVWVKLPSGTNLQDLYLGAMILNGNQQLSASAWREWRR